MVDSASVSGSELIAHCARRCRLPGSADGGHEPQECSTSLVIASVDPRLVQDLGKHLTYLALDHRCCVGLSDLVSKAAGPSGMRRSQFVRAQIPMRDQDLGDGGQFVLQTRRQYRKPHHLDQSDVLLLDVMQFGVRMVDAEWMLIGGDVVSQHQIKFECVAAATGVMVLCGCPSVSAKMKASESV